MSGDTWHEHVVATWNPRGVIHGISHVVHLCELFILNHVSNGKLWEKKIHENKEKNVRVTSGKGEGGGKFPHLDNFMDKGEKEEHPNKRRRK